MAEKIVFTVSVVIVLVLVLVATRPETFHVERSITIAASPEDVLPCIHDFRQWSAWSPYDALDPDMKRTYAGPSSGVGARYAWSGNSKAGQGEMAIERSDGSRVVIALHLLRPLDTRSTASFTLTPSPEGTRVTWAVDGTNGFAEKALSLLVNVDERVGRDFERGLAALRAAAGSSGAACRT